MSGTIDAGELAASRTKAVCISTSDKLMEIMSTHPNMLRRMQRLSSLTWADGCAKGKLSRARLLN
ncbi:MAG: hypothetical protein NTU41_05100 [Chloroflexi bacterium]|nr:hypothetical protein [Chloroflexota bacterium]